MPEPQPVLTPLTQSAIFLVVTVRAGGEQQVRELLADVPGIGRSVGFREPDGELKAVVGIGAELWHRMFDGPRPPALHPFRELHGPKHHAPSTPGDLLFHIRARRMDLCFEFAAQVMRRLDGAADVVDEVHGFKYFDERDLLGFVDGTENPIGSYAANAAIIADGEFVGGSYVIIQKYLHDLDAWNALTVEEQERVIGRSKLDDMEQPDDVKAPDAHIALNVIEDDDGNELKIVRDNMPFGRLGDKEFGTYFIGYASDPTITERMLRNMFLGDPPGRTDRILDFSTAHTGCLFFVPSQDWLDAL
jgi:putative iron-dependent peroxidase